MTTVCYTTEAAWHLVTRTAVWQALVDPGTGFQGLGADYYTSRNWSAGRREVPSLALRAVYGRPSRVPGVHQRAPGRDDDGPPASLELVCRREGCRTTKWHPSRPGGQRLRNARPRPATVLAAHRHLPAHTAATDHHRSPVHARTGPQPRPSRHSRRPRHNRLAATVSARTPFLVNPPVALDAMPATGRDLRAFRRATLARCFRASHGARSPPPRPWPPRPTRSASCPTCSAVSPPPVVRAAPQAHRARPRNLQHR